MANPLAEPNYIGDHAVVSPTGARYFCEPGSSTITVLGKQNEVLQTLAVTDERGLPLAIERLHYDKLHGELLAIVGPDLYAIDAGGRARLVPIPQDAGRDPLYNKMEMRQREEGTPEERAAKVRAGEIADRLRRGANVSAADREFLDDYNGPQPAVAAKPVVRPAAPQVARPPDPAEIARKEAAVKADAERRARGEVRTPMATPPVHVTLDARDHLGVSTLDEFPAAPAVGM